MMKRDYFVVFIVLCSVTIITLLMLARSVYAFEISHDKQEALIKTEPSKKLNVLLIVIDDLRTELSCYGKKNIITPNIDRLAQEGVTFINAYCQKAVCVPSRQSFLSGMRPNDFGAGFNTHFRDKLPQCITLPQQFQRNGYRVESVGKVFHHRDPVSWDIPSWVAEPEICYPVYLTKENIKIQKKRIADGMYFPKEEDWWAKGGMWTPAGIWEAPDVNDDSLTDGKLANYAISRLKEIKNNPFFLAVGFFRPHLPFIAPKKYYDMYPISEIELPEYPNLPGGAPGFARQSGGEWRSYHDVVGNDQMPDAKTQKEYIRGYKASVSYVDAQLGRLISNLDSLGLSENTIVVLMADNGYHLFDKSSFGKSTNFEDATRVPLIFRMPDGQSANMKTSALVELIDIYPTLCDLTNLPIPIEKRGLSFKNVIFNPLNQGKEAAYSQYIKEGNQGYSVRTNRFRYTEWKRQDKIVAQELYDYKLDPNETKNMVGIADYNDTMHNMANLLKEAFNNQ